MDVGVLRGLGAEPGHRSTHRRALRDNQVIGEIRRGRQQFPIAGTALPHLVGGADIEQAPGVEDRDPVGQGKHGSAAGENDRGAIRDRLPQHLLNSAFDDRIHGRGRVVHDQQPRLVQ
ncbi:Uncharacterised protein [Mycobacterium tuberculosis]|uniref:Uncharacterized protein n=1 Tax=Mycobacterium tuberculosis TaxID=1773 RepID=A0A655ASQ3_MYCTX|nr:Uncharacterised protein [Mycobacterium tuberculosis]CKT06208.1 Uncharacterised protein [Mycobacterium tuberculosis]CKT57793.1 Uncharacterised protein [Mycobacterium tuberculosis]CKT61717.1 Uncharacterised protein [Mycobacterium tuberculosis]CNV20970.1 Uncharacterised protein [Mycobacterium tuberculosis]